MPASHYNRPARVPPPADTLPFPGNLVRNCSECGLRNGCVAPVPAENVELHEVMFVGEAPGRQEDEWGFVPFCGQAGQYLDSLLFQCSISRESVCLSNTCHCRPPNNRTPKADEIRACSKWLKMELDIVQPHIIVALGKPATDVFLPGNNNTMEHLHGKPVEKDGRIILPSYHPAFALRDTSKMRQVSDDFQVLRGLVKGRDWREYHVVDEYPNPKYSVVDTPDKMKMMEYLIEQAGEFAIDTEQCQGELWSVQISCKEGEAYFIPIKSGYQGRVDLSHLKATAIVHYYLHDIQYVKLDETNFVDTMTQAYLLGQSQGLKELSSRLCGIQMITYREMVKSGQQKLSLEYLLKASDVTWPDPPTIEETKWDNKKGCLVTKNKKPWHISRKINKMLDDYGKDDNTDLWDRWRNIPEEERVVVESVIGTMPESSLVDIPFLDAVQYGCRDADSTLRVYHKLKKMIIDLDLDFVLDMDLGILPMVNYNEVVKLGQQRLSLEYLLKASGMEWPDPPTIEETKWDNKKGCLVTKNKKPWHISRKVAKMLADFGKDDNTDLWDRWRNIPEEERVVVEVVLGAMPESSLADIPFLDAVAYSCRDSDSTLRVYHKLKKMIIDLDLDFVLDMDLGILPMVNSMMQNGMAVDLDHLRKLSDDYDVRMRVLSEAMAGVVGHPFNPNSSDQVAVVIYGELVGDKGNKFNPTKKTPTGKISTDDAELKKTGHPVAKDIIRYRGIQKLKSTYADALIEWARPDEQGVPRVHTTLKTTRVATGRLASADPNLQNIPTRNKESKQIKRGFIAPRRDTLRQSIVNALAKDFFDTLMAEGDLGQVEMRTQAHLAKCKGLIELFLSGKDPHTTTASKLFGVPYEDASQNKYRYPCKRAGFGIIYMIGAQGLSTQINEYIADLEMEGEPVDIDAWDETRCQKFIDDYYLLYPEIKDYQQEKLAEARRYGYVRDPISGRIRYIPEVSCPIRSIAEGGARMAANFPVTTCLPADTRVTTREGWLPIGDFKDGMDVWTGEKWVTARKLSMGVHPRVRLHLSDGRTFDCDVNHKLLVQIGVWPEWKNVMDISEDEPLSQDTLTDWGVPLFGTEDWYWAGRFIGDGWLSGPAAKIKFWGMSFGSKEVQDGDRLMQWLSTKNINGHTNSKTGYYPEYDRRGNFKIVGGTQAGYALWQSLGMAQKKAKEKRVPSVVFTLDFDRRMAFFRGYSDADGTMRQSMKRGRANSWSITSASRGLLEDTARLASTLGFTAYISEPKTRTYDWSSVKMRENRNYAPRCPTASTSWYCSVSTYQRSLTIISREILDSEPMYTLSVDDERHAFASEGLISKNSAQAIIKTAMGRLWQELPRTEWSDAKCLLQIHDSLLFEIRDDEDYVRPFLSWVRNVMCNVISLSVPIEVDFKIGKRWGELAKVAL